MQNADGAPGGPGAGRGRGAVEALACPQINL